MSSTPLGLASPSSAAPAVRASTTITSSTAKISEVISLYRPTKLFRRDPNSVNPTKDGSQSSILSIDYDDEGCLLLTAETDNSLQVYNIKEGKQHKSYPSQKYGCNHAMFTHASGCIIHSSTKTNHDIRYLSTHDNGYLRYFEGHTENVTNLAMHPGNDNFLSCSEDNTVRIWDIGTKNACGKLNLNGAYLSAWDPSGNVFAVASPTAQAILLYDFRNYDKPPFSTFDILEISQEPMSKSWTKLEFSNDGKHLLLGRTSQSHLLIDAFDGHLKAHLQKGDRMPSRRLAAGEQNRGSAVSNTDFLLPTAGDACFTPDGRYVISGGKKNVLVWDTLASAQSSNLAPSHELEYNGESAVVAFNPRYNFFATADSEVVFWVPDAHSM
ncbi:WD repeat-containing protein-like protein [Calycina marina]|uniref:WD repeat-containing protein-like protein n=1 Tax=Calycina marina TaxID=1763456 RepID=A0A9P8CFU3_9HELO|nr:WD repeat-containing protein-like protein [Calycina marina]